MKYQCQRRKSAARDLIGEIGQPEVLLPVFIHRDRALLRLRERSDIVKRTCLLGDRIAHLIELLVQQMFDRSNARHVVHELLNPFADHPSNVGRATHIRRHRWLVQVDRWWLPRAH